MWKWLCKCGRKMRTVWEGPRTRSADAAEPDTAFELCHDRAPRRVDVRVRAVHVAVVHAPAPRLRRRHLPTAAVRGRARQDLLGPRPFRDAQRPVGARCDELPVRSWLEHPLLVGMRAAGVAVAVAGLLPDDRVMAAAGIDEGRRAEAAAILRQHEHVIGRRVVPRLAVSADAGLHPQAETCLREVRRPSRRPVVGTIPTGRGAASDSADETHQEPKPAACAVLTWRKTRGGGLRSRRTVRNHRAVA